MRSSARAMVCAVSLVTGLVVVGCTSSGSSVEPLPTSITAGDTVAASVPATAEAPAETAGVTVATVATVATTAATAATAAGADVTQEDASLKNDLVITADEQAATAEQIKSLGYTNIGLRVQHFTPVELTALAVAACAALGDNPTRRDLGHLIAKRLRVTDGEGSTVWLAIAEYACHDAAAAWDLQAS